MAWLREIFGLLRQYRQVNKDYRASMRALDKRIADFKKEMPNA